MDHEPGRQEDLGREGIGFVTDHLLSDLHQRTARGGLLALGGHGSRALVGVATLAVMSRLLEPSDFGLVGMAAVVAGFAGLFTDFGLSTATIQRRQVDQNIVSGLFYLSLANGFAIAGLVALSAPLMARIYSEPDVAKIVAALAFTIPVIAAGRQHAALLQRGMRWGRFEGFQTAATVTGSIAGVAAAIGGLGPWSLVVNSWASAVASLLFLWALNPWKPGRVTDWRAVRDSLGFGLSLTGFSVINFVHRQADDFMIGVRWGATELGFYGRAYSLLSVPLQLVRGPVATVMVSSLSRLQDDDRSWARLYTRALKAVLLAVAPLSLVLVLIAPELVRIILGPGWDRTGRIFGFLAVSIVAQLVMSSTGWLWISAGQPQRMLRWAAWSVPFMVLGMVLGLPFGPEGVALGYSVAFCVLTPVCTWYASRTLPITARQVYGAVVRPVTCAVVAFGLALASPNWGNGLVDVGLRVVVLLGIYVSLVLLWDRTFVVDTLKIVRMTVRVGRRRRRVD